MRLVCDNLYYRYPGTDTPVFKGLSFGIDRPGFISLFGFSGIGKSTLARIISGEIPPDKGRVDVETTGQILYSHNAERFPGWESTGHHLERVCDYGKRDLLAHLIEEYAVAPYLHSRYSGLSMGQKNRMNLIRYLVQDFGILIADEVLANVDEPTRNHILAGIKELLADRIFLYISHNALEVARFSRLVLVLPQNPEEGHTAIRIIDGLDEGTGQRTYEERTLQDRVYQLLRAASGMKT